MPKVFAAGDKQFSSYWEDLFARDPFQHPLYSQRLDHGNRQQAPQYQDRSFLVVHDDEPIFGCSLTLHAGGDGRRHLGYFGLDAVTHVNRHSMLPAINNFRPDAIQALRDYTSDLLATLQPDSVSFLDPVSCGIMSPVSQVLLEQGAKPTIYQAQVLDMRCSSLALQHGLRPSFRSMVSWGLRNLDFSIEENMTQSCGEATAAQSDLAWNRIALLREYDSLLPLDNTFNVQARRGGNLVGSVLCARTDKVCYLIASSCLADTEPMSVLHSMLWQAIEHVKALGCEQFDLGLPVQDTSQEFELGFGGNSSTRLKFHLTA